MTDASAFVSMTDLSDRAISRYQPAMGDVRYFRPPLPAGYVSREPLIERLHTGLEGRLIVLCAPAGFGKSSLATEFCQSLGAQWRTQWQGLDRREEEAGRFLESLVQGLLKVIPAVGREALQLLRLRQPHQPFSYESWLDEWLLDIARHVNPQQPLLIVLDDYHLVQGPVVDHCLQYLLQNAPAGLVVMLCTRQRPALHLARLRLARQVLELNELDLRLTLAEATQLLGGETQIPSDEVAGLLERSEGWVAGLRLWSLMPHRSDAQSGFLRGLHGNEGLIKDYLLEEVIAQLPSELQLFLYETAGLERFCASLCDELRDAHDSEALLQYLREHQVFLVPLDDQGIWFRYHHLFSDLLRDRPHTAVQSRASVHLKACRWFSAQGYASEAVDHALLAGRTDVAASLVQNLSEEQMLAEQNVALLLRWKLDLPDELLVSSPRLISLYGWALVLAFQFDAAEDLANAMGRYLPAPSEALQRALVAQWLALNSMILRGRGELKVSEQRAIEALQSLPAERYGLRLMCFSNLANQALSAGQIHTARVFNRQALELSRKVGNPLFEALVNYDRARVLFCRGEIQRALLEVRMGLQCLQGMSVQRHYAVRARLLIYEGVLLFCQRHYLQARECLLQGIREAKACRDACVVIGYCTLASLERRSGTVADGFVHLAEAERVMHLWDVPAVCYLAMITLVKCELWQAQGQSDMAQTWLQRLYQTYCEEGAAAPELSPQLALRIQLQYAEWMMAQERWQDALVRVQHLYEQVQILGSVRLQTMCLLVQIYKTLGQDKEAQQWLARCLDEAGAGMLQALEAIRGTTPSWLGHALRQCAQPEVQQALAQGLISQPSVPKLLLEALSGRELDVLQLIAQGCSNQQISEQLFISLHTVKSHARRINEKLGVERRTQAVAQAKQLGLLV